MSTLLHWAQRHAVSAQALADLRALFNLDPAHSETPAIVDRTLTSEAGVQAMVRVEASRMGWRLFRNNLGAGKLDNGSFLRWGLCNDSQRLNDAIKSSDLVGWTGTGRFAAIECKEPGWRYTGTPREVAQLKWLELVAGAGGVALFVTGPGQLPKDTL